MIKEGINQYTEGGDPPIPYTGKYAVKKASFFADVRKRRVIAGRPEAAYAPLRLEVELTTKCNDTCPSCGMGALSLADGITMSEAQIDHLVEQSRLAAVPSISITGGEPFAAMRPLLRFIKSCAAANIDISKLTTNGIWGSDRRCNATFDQLERSDLLAATHFVPLLMLSIGEQTTPLERIARIIHTAVRRYTERELNIAVSSLADPATRIHKVYDLISQYEAMFAEDFPHDRVHSTMRVYLNNDRLDTQNKVSRPGNTSVSKWMRKCFSCFAPTVGAYVLPTALVKQDGSFYTCAAFNVPEKLAFGNIFDEPLTTILDRINDSAYVKKVRIGNGLEGIRSDVPESVTDAVDSPSFCDSCAFLIDEHDRRTGHTTGIARRSSGPVLLGQVRTLSGSGR